MKKTFLIISIIAVLFSFYSISHATLLGTAGDYNAFVFGDMDLNTSDSQGRIAAGGNIKMKNYSIGLNAAVSDYSMVSGGNIGFTSGHVFNGGIFSGGNATLDHLGVDGKVVANGTIAFSSGSSAGIVPNAGVINPVDFTDAYNYLNFVSSTLAGMDPNGVTTVTPWRAITLTGAGPLSIFSLDGAALNNASSITFNIGTDDVAVINISGDIDKFGGFGIFNTAGKEGNILYNFYEAGQLSVSKIAVKGSILAPHADVIFNSGRIDGTLIANSATGTGQFNSYRFDHDVPVNVVPEPGTISLI
ncbi:MAG: choice-of-anchor A family protein, partial [Nitrospirota bacterium]|nr:choice-of-anchor A family protein [Nitrospirota bacterium]